MTFSIVFGVIVYRITTAAALSLNKATRSNVRVTVTATAVIINLVVILILDEIYGAVAKWLTKIGMESPPPMLPLSSIGCCQFSVCKVSGGSDPAENKGSPEHLKWRKEKEQDVSLEGLCPGRNLSWNILDQ